MNKKYLKDFVDAQTDSSLLEQGGGKFFGLCEANDLVRRLPQDDDVIIRIPQTKVIPFAAFETLLPQETDDIDAHFNNLKLPEDLMFEVKCYLAKIGGKAAIRSSAKGEDGHKEENACRAGVYDTFLNTKISDVHHNIVGVLRSAYNSVVLSECKNHKDIQMGVLVQEMIKPKLSGVAYSQPFIAPEDDVCTDTAKMVIHYVENATADQMIVNKQHGIIRKMEKYLALENDSQFEFCGIENLSRNAQYAHFLSEIKQNYKKSPEKYENAFVEASLMKLTALSNYFEQNMKHAVDMEWAVEADPKTGMPVINVLQQRPYKSLDNFRIRRSDASTISGYLHGKSVITDNVMVIEGAVDADISDSYHLPDVSDKIVLLKVRTQDEMQVNREDYEKYLTSTLMAHHHLVGNEMYRDAKAVVDTTGFLMTALYGHYGNELRRNNIPFMITGDKTFRNIENGDKITLDMKKGSYKQHTPRVSKQKKLAIGNIISSLKEYHK